MLYEQSWGGDEIPSAYIGECLEHLLYEQSWGGDEIPSSYIGECLEHGRAYGTAIRDYRLPFGGDRQLNSPAPPARLRKREKQGTRINSTSSSRILHSAVIHARVRGTAGKGSGGRGVHRRGVHSPRAVHHESWVVGGRHAAVHVRGSMASPPRRTSKCRCGPKDRPVLPTVATTCPARRACPGRAMISQQCAYLVSQPSPWSTWGIQGVGFRA